MGLLADIQNDVISDTTPVASVLRKCMVLASNLDSALLEDWVKYELHGYPKDVEVPEYRRIGMNFKITASNLAWQMENHPVPQLLIRKVLSDPEFDVFRCRQAIGTINATSDSNGVMYVNLDNYALVLSGKVIDRSYNIHRFWGEIPTSKVVGVLDAVRNRVLEFVLALKKEYPNAGEVDGLTTKEQAVEQAVTQIFNTTINGNAGVVGNANNSTVNIVVSHGNIAELKQQLTQSGVGADDLAELEKAIANEPTIGEDQKFGPKVTKWIGGMLGKAASGVWSVSLAAGGALLEKALLGYYGY